MDGSTRLRLRHTYRMSYDGSREQHVLLGPETVIVLNDTSAEILQLCDGDRTLRGVVDELTTRYDAVVEDEVVRFATDATSRGLLEVVDG